MVFVSVGIVDAADYLSDEAYIREHRLQKVPRSINLSNNNGAVVVLIVKIALGNINTCAAQLNINTSFIVLYSRRAVVTREEKRL